MTRNDLIEIRCKNLVVKKPKTNPGKQEVCNKLCVRVNTGSSGSVTCNRCGHEFTFDVFSNSSVRDTFNLVKPS